MKIYLLYISLFLGSLSLSAQNNQNATNKSDLKIVQLTLSKAEKVDTKSLDNRVTNMAIASSNLVFKRISLEKQSTLDEVPEIVCKQTSQKSSPLKMINASFDAISKPLNSKTQITRATKSN